MVWEAETEAERKEFALRIGRRFMDRVSRRIERCREAVCAASHSAQQLVSVQPVARPVPVEARKRRYRG
jgi:hypothetical protein